VKLNQEWKQAYRKSGPTNRLHVRLLLMQVILQAAITATLLFLAL